MNGNLMLFHSTKKGKSESYKRKKGETVRANENRMKNEQGYE